MELVHFIQHGISTKKPVTANRPKESKSIVSDFIKLIDEFKQGKHLTNGRRKSKASIDGYEQIVNVLKSYEEHSKSILTRKRIIEESTIQLIMEYVVTNLALSQNTVGKRMKDLKAMLGLMTRKKLIGYNPFIAFQISIPKEESFSIALTQEELMAIEKLDLSDNRTQDIIRDHFLVMCFTGLRVSDYLRFVHFRQETPVIGVLSTKTGEYCHVPIFPPTKRILEKWGGVLPQRYCAQKMAMHIKCICAKIPSLCEVIDKPMTKGGIRTISRHPRYELVANHTARRTFITQMRRWGLTYDQVMAMTGHKDLRSIRIYDKMLKSEVTKKVMDDLKSRFDAWGPDDKNE